MKLYKILAFFVVISIFFMSCEKEMITFDAADSFVAFEKTSGAVGEESSSDININVLVASLKGSDVTVSFDFTTDGLDNPAIEGEDFEIVNTSNTLVIESGVGSAAIIIRPIDNDVRDLDKTVKFTITSNSANYPIGMAEGKGIEYLLTISDNEHPLALVLGDYEEHDYYYSDGSHDEYSPYDITIAPVDDDETKVEITNYWGGGDYTIIAEVDIDAKTFNILPGQVIYVSGTYGDCKAVKIDSGSYAPDDAIIGAFDDSGNITIGSWAALVSAGSYGNYLKSELIKK